MPMEENLRSRLVQYIRRKFNSYPNVAVLADDIVNEAYALLLGSKSYSPDKENFGYLSMTCIRVAYRIFMSDRSGCESLSDYEGVYSMLVGEDDFVDELARLMYFDDESRYYEKMKTGYDGFTKHFLLKII